MKTLYLVVPFAPLVGALVAGLLGRVIGRTLTHTLTILGVAVSLACSAMVLADVLEGNTFNGTLYTWMSVGGVPMQIGFLIDSLSAVMMVVVTFVSLMVHVYTIGYMHDDPGYQRFFSYISLFTFAMLMLVMSNNFLQLFFGWEAVGLVSYLLIGFWYTRPTAIFANLKAFLVNRIGDFGFLLGIALVVMHFGSLDYATVFQGAPAAASETVELIPGLTWSLITVICILLFVGAMGKSAQFPLHVWLPDSMEGPTPISALIHAATMVTAGIFMVSRMSPLFELSVTALAVVLAVGTITAFFMGLLGLVMNDIKRVVAYSTLSQLGYMTVALGAGAYAAGMFHLVTHAFFKALLFLGAGSVIIALHHEQDMRRMGGLRKYMPITYLTAVIGSLALAGIPPFAGFFSKDAIIEAVHLSSTPGHGVAYIAVLSGVFITSLYTFRMLFMTFHGPERFRESADDHHGHASHAHALDTQAPDTQALDTHGAPGHDMPGQDARGHDVHAGHGDAHGHAGPPRESPWVVTVPLILLAIPSIYAGWAYIEPFLFGDLFTGVIASGETSPLTKLADDFHGPAAFVLHGLQAPPFWLALAGFVVAWYLYIRRPDLPGSIASGLGGIYRLLANKYYLDDINQSVFAGGARRLGTLLWKAGDVAVIDGFFVNGAARLVGFFSGVMRHFQSGYVYHYAFMMIIGLFVLLTLWFARA
ncbi:MAG: NADH-quinone oxidoreductase subunit L [Burkholderiales bacterium]|nr:NADH-quinone oxidoreductase subunit L [Burkholderiales bacterium]